MVTRILIGVMAGALTSAVVWHFAVANATPLDDSFNFGSHLQSPPGLLFGNGVCDLRFGLFDDATGGAQLGASETLANVPVVDFDFVVELNKTGAFGPKPFPGDDRWLAIDTRCASAEQPGQPPVPSGPFAAQPTRFPVPVVAYALWSKDSGVDLSGLWNIKGNAGTSPPLNFLGTTDASPLAIVTNNVERVRVDTGGRVGIGTKSPATSLHIADPASVELRLEADTDDAEEADQPSLVLSQDGGTVAGRLGFFGGTNDLTLVNGAGNVAIVLRANGDVCIGSGC